ncbi:MULTISPECIES: PhzF family phenazine biosynthesis protein [Clavibacter]|nr:PhzF family phenazine biosynthesis protein [Clavibacter michiganensis]
MNRHGDLAADRLTAGATMISPHHETDLRRHDDGAVTAQIDAAGSALHEQRPGGSIDAAGFHGPSDRLGSRSVRPGTLGAPSTDQIMRGRRLSDMLDIARQRDFRQVDVFGATAGTGNPVAVVLDADGLDEATMRRFSAWTNLSECTFVLPPTSPGADYRVRIFSLDLELPFAGHPTLGTVRAWLDAGNTPNVPGRVTQECMAGLVPIRVEDDTLAFVAPPRTRSGCVDPDLLAAISRILGIGPGDVVAAEWLDNGPGWVGVLLADADAVLALRPDAATEPGRWDIGVLGLRDPSKGSALEVRAFFTDGSEPLREDPVTGSLNAAAAEWLIAAGRIAAPYTAAQGGAMGRHGLVHIEQDQDGLWVGGRADVLIAGTVIL